MSVTENMTDTTFSWTGYYQITLDNKSRWENFQWRVDNWQNGHPVCMGWFGSYESALAWITKQIEKI